MNLRATATGMIALSLWARTPSVSSAPSSDTVAEFDEGFIRGILETLLPGEGPVVHLRRRRDMLSRARVAVYHCQVGMRTCLLKVGPASDPAPNPSLNDLLVQRPSASFRVPRLYGAVVSNATRFELWQYVHGCSKFFDEYSDAELEGLLHAIAASDSEPFALDGIRQTYWLKPVGPALRKAVSTSFPQFRDDIDRFSSRERRLIEHAEKLGSDCITHNDLHGHNVIVGPETYHLVDWESASLGPPGATLRAFMDWPRPRVEWIATRYAAFLNDFGIQRSSEDILFSMRVHHTYMKLRTGLRLKKFRRIRSGLEHFRRLENELTGRT